MKVLNYLLASIQSALLMEIKMCAKHFCNWTIFRAGTQALKLGKSCENVKIV